MASSLSMFTFESIKSNLEEYDKIMEHVKKAEERDFRKS